MLSIARSPVKNSAGGKMGIAGLKTPSPQKILS